MTNRAFIIGEFVDGDVNVERFRATAMQLQYDVDALGDYRQAMTKLSIRSNKQRNEEHDLVLFCVGPTLRSIGDYLKKLRSLNRQIMVYAHPGRSSPQAAVEYCHDGYADDFLIWGEHVAGNRIEEHVKALHQKKSPYPRIEVKYAPADGSRARVFIATPFDRESRMVMSDAVDYVLEKINLTPCWADEVYRISVPEKISEEIRRSKLVIANISQGQHARPNPNVYYEAGQAVGLGIPVIFVRPVEEKNLPVPADISERGRIEYDNPVDLSMRLYRGLRNE